MAAAFRITGCPVRWCTLVCGVRGQAHAWPTRVLGCWALSCMQAWATLIHGHSFYLHDDVCPVHTIGFGEHKDGVCGGNAEHAEGQVLTQVPWVRRRHRDQITRGLHKQQQQPPRIPTELQPTWCWQQHQSVACALTLFFQIPALSGHHSLRPTHTRRVCGILTC